MTDIHKKADWKHGRNNTIFSGGGRNKEYAEGKDKDGLDRLSRHIIEEVKYLKTYGGFEDSIKEVWDE